MGLLRSLFSLILLCLFLFVALTVPLGSRTLFGHVVNIWSSAETQELVEGVKERGAPLVDRVKRGVEAGLSTQADNTKPRKDSGPGPDMRALPVEVH